MAAAKKPASKMADPQPKKKNQVTSRTSVNTGFSGGVGSAPKGARGYSTIINPSNKGGRPKTSPNMLPAGKSKKK